jgi:membrane protease YdiL (CAAX protease family)
MSKAYASRGTNGKRGSSGAPAETGLCIDSLHSEARLPFRADERKSAVILFAIAAVEGAWCVANMQAHPLKFMRYTGFIGDANAGPLGWSLALAAAVLFVASAVRLPSVRANLLAVSRLKVLGLAVAVTAGFCEEAIFRKLLMDGLQHAGYGVALQITVSGAAFGVAHGVWGAFRGSAAAALGAILATGLLGAALAIVYVASHRILAPCIVSHFLINALAEPGLVLAAVRGEMSGSTVAGKAGAVS